MNTGAPTGSGWYFSGEARKEVQRAAEAHKRIKVILKSWEKPTER